MILPRLTSVSYTHLDVYKRQIEIYEELETIGGFEGESAEYYQKFGYALQKRKKYAEAIQALSLIHI